MAGSSKSSTDDEEIKRWAEERGGHPAIVPGTEGRGGGAGLLRIDFVGDEEGKDPRPAPVSWDAVFRPFGEKHLSFLCQDGTAGGKESRFFKFVNRDGE